MREHLLQGLGENPEKQLIEAHIHFHITSHYSPTIMSTSLINPCSSARKAWATEKK